MEEVAEEMASDVTIVKMDIDSDKLKSDIKIISSVDKPNAECYN